MINKKDLGEIAQAFVNNKGSESELNKAVGQDFIRSMGLMMDKLYDSLQQKQTLHQDNVKKPRLGG